MNSIKISTILNKYRRFYRDLSGPSPDKVTLFSFMEWKHGENCSIKNGTTGEIITVTRYNFHRKLKTSLKEKKYAILFNRNGRENNKGLSIYCYDGPFKELDVDETSYNLESLGRLIGFSNEPNYQLLLIEFE